MNFSVVSSNPVMDATMQSRREGLPHDRSDGTGAHLLLPTIEGRPIAKEAGRAGQPMVWPPSTTTAWPMTKAPGLRTARGRLGRSLPGARQADGLLVDERLAPLLRAAGIRTLLRSEVVCSGWSLLVCSSFEVGEF